MNNKNFDFKDLMQFGMFIISAIIIVNFVFIGVIFIIV